MNKKSKIVSIEEKISSAEMINLAINCDIINLADIRNEYEKMKREEYLSKHKHSVWQAEDGKWKTYFDNEKGITDKNGKEKKYILAVRTTEEAMKDLIVQHYKSKECEPYINQVFEEWITERLSYGEISKQSYNRYTNTFKRFFPKTCLLCQKKFKQITEDDLEEFIRKTIHEEELTAKVYSGLRTVMNGIFKYGKKRKYTEISITNFFGDLDLSQRAFKKNIKDKESEVFNETEIGRVKDHLQKRGTIRDLGVLLVFETGVRVGELSALKKEDIIKDRNCIHIQRTEVSYKDPDTKEAICEVRDFPKTDAGDRYIIVPQSAMNIIEQIIVLNPNCEYLFSENGKRIRSNAFNRRLSRTCDELHIKHRSMHKIRKTYGTTLLDGKVDESTVAEQMGHKDIATTRKFYYRSNKSDATKFAQISKALSN